MTSPSRAFIEKKSPACVAMIAMIGLASCGEDEATTTIDATATRPPAAEDLGARLDQVIAAFYQANVGKSAHMLEMIDAIKAKAGADGAVIDTLVQTWLLEEACPVDVASLCP